jgi:flavin reductase (DIM6/NTAB) family NADH-FMN oxidoreductase RutF
MPVESDHIRHVLSHLPGGVCIVTSLDADGRPSGLTAISVCSVSLDPPLVLACIDRSTTTHAAIESSRAYALNFLGATHRALADRFSAQGDKFEGIEHASHRTGSPVLADAVAYCDCRVIIAIPAADHTIFVARVESAAAGEVPVAGSLVRYRGRYEALASGGRDNPE